MDTDKLWSKAEGMAGDARRHLNAVVEREAARLGGAVPSERALDRLAMAIAVLAVQRQADLSTAGRAWAAAVLQRPTTDEDARRLQHVSAGHGSDIRVLAETAEVDLVETLLLDARWGPFPIDLDTLAARADSDVEALILLTALAPERGDLLHAASEAPDANDRLAAARAWVRRRSAEDQLDAIRQPAPFVRVAACEALSKLPENRDCIEPLFALLDDDHELVRTRAFWAVVNHAGWTKPNHRSSAPLNVLHLRITCLLEAVSGPARARLRALLEMDDAEGQLEYRPSDPSVAHRRILPLLHADPIPLEPLRKLTGHDRAWLDIQLLRALHPSLGRAQTPAALRALDVEGREEAMAEARVLYQADHAMVAAIDFG